MLSTIQFTSSFLEDTLTLSAWINLSRINLGRRRLRTGTTNKFYELHISITLTEDNKVTNN